jgi:hypothetical protein
MLTALAASLVLAAAFVVPAQAQSSHAPTASEVGVTAKEIHIAVVADVDNAAAPGVFQGSVDAVRGFARFVNASGGLAGRKVVVDFIDSHLNPNEARNAVIKACGQDFAMVGTAAEFLNNVDDEVACKDMAGATTGLPDIPFLTTEVAQECSSVTFPVNPPQLVCSTKTQHPQTYQAGVGRGFYYKKKFGNLHGVYVFPNDLKSAHDATVASGLGQLRQVCCKSDKDFDLSALAPQSAFTPVVEAIKNNSSTYAQSASTLGTSVALRKEAKIQGVTSVKVWDCSTQCYAKQFVQQGGADVDGQFVDTAYLPFYNSADRRVNKMAGAFYKYLGPDKAGELGASYSWIAGVAFRDAVNAVVKTHGVNGLTRKNLLDALNGMHNFNADGFYAGVDLASRTFTSGCHVLNQLKNGTFVRVLPTKPGTFDCPKGALLHPKLDLVQG